jgi:hypothetical protein
MRKTLLCLVGCALLTLPASASHWRGIRATLQNVDQVTRVVDISVTGYTSERSPFTETYVEENTPYVGIGDSTDTANPAVAWGDGELIQSTELPGVAGGPFATYRGAFSHTYEAPGAYTIRVTSECCAPTPEQSEYAEMITGNFIYEGTLSNTVQVVLGGLVSEVPLSRGGLITLAALLAGAAMWLVRRG